MKQYLQAVPTDIHQLAEDACRSMGTSSAGGDDESGHESLAVGLERVRGMAVERVKAANVRLRRRAVGGTALGLGVGIAMGLLASRIRSETREGGLTKAAAI